MQAYRRLLRRLKLAYPQHSVSVRRVRVPGRLMGDCGRHSDGWRIRIDTRLDEQSAMDALVHEFPHVPAWGEWEDIGEHGIVWAYHYAKCYRIYEEIVDAMDF